MSDGKKVQISDMRTRFNNRGFGVTAYARAYGVSHSVLSQVLDKKLDGTKEVKGSTRVIMKQLKKDGVIRGRLSWEK